MFRNLCYSDPCAIFNLQVKIENRRRDVKCIGLNKQGEKFMEMREKKMYFSHQVMRYKRLVHPNETYKCVTIQDFGGRYELIFILEGFTSKLDY